MHQNLYFEYFVNIHSQGFIQAISHTTRIQGNTHSLIDHILVNSPTTKIQSGTLISDISDHFFTFITVGHRYDKRPVKKKTARKFTQQNIDSFKNHLTNCNWNNVLQEQDVNVSYNLFWEKFKLLYDNSFPEITQKFNKNYHKINPFMTTGLLTSRRNKLMLHQLTCNSPTVDNIRKYKQYRAMYNTLVRAMKKQYYCSNLIKAQKKPKKSWQLIKEAMNMQQKTDKIEKNSSRQ